MSYTAPLSGGAPIAISTHGALSCLDVRNMSSSVLWPSNNLAIYVPVRFPFSCIVYKLAIGTAGVASGNFDVGLYDLGGTRLVSAGSTAMSGTTTEQVVNTTDTTVGPGTYYLALSISNTSAQVRAILTTAPLPLSCGVLSEALGSVTLPATATFAASQTLAMAPLILAFIEPTVA